MKKDRIVENVIEQFRQRSEVGIKKYGTTLEDNNEDDYLLHLQQELMDGILYIQKKREQNGTLQDFRPQDISRLEIIDETGRVFVKRNIVNFDISLQDEGKTFKIFIRNKNLNEESEDEYYKTYIQGSNKPI